MTTEAQREVNSWFEKVERLCIANGAPEGWQLAVSEMLGTFPNYTHYQFKGAVYPPLVRGPRKGRPNYRRPVPGTERTFVFDNATVRALA